MSSVCGIIYGVGEKKRLVGPFLSLGVAVRFYQGEFRAGNLKESKYGQYLFNICEQLEIFKPTHVAFENFSSLPLTASTPGDSARVLFPKSQIIKDYVKMENALAVMAPPPVNALETHGGTLTLKDYIAADPTYGTGQVPLVNYLQQKQRELVRRKENRSHDKPDEMSLYVINYEKNKTDLESIHRIDFKNSWFQNFLSCRPHTRTQKLQNGGRRIIWSSGQNINTRATRLLYPDMSKSEREVYRLKGLVFVGCSPKADLKLQGFLPVQPNWVPVLDKPDNHEDLKEKDKDAKPKDPREAINYHWEEDDSDSDSDSDSSDDDEDTQAPQVTQEPATKKTKKRLFPDNPTPPATTNLVITVPPPVQYKEPTPPDPPAPNPPVAEPVPNVKRQRRRTPAP